MSEKEVYELTLIPQGEDTLITTREEFEALVKQVFEEEGQGDLLTDGSVTMRAQRPFPGADLGLIVLIWIGKTVATEIFKRKVLPKLETRFEAWWTKKSSDTPDTSDTDPKNAS